MCGSFSGGSSCFVSLIASPIFVPVKAGKAAEGARIDGKCSSVLCKVCLVSECHQGDAGCKCVSTQTGSMLCSSTVQLLKSNFCQCSPYNLEELLVAPVLKFLQAICMGAKEGKTSGHLGLDANWRPMF